MGIPLESGKSSSKKILENLDYQILRDLLVSTKQKKPVFLGKIIKKGLADKAQIL